MSYSDSKCPDCQRVLEENPISGNKACFPHGDYVWNNKKQEYVWRPLKRPMTKRY